MIMRPRPWFGVASGLASGMLFLLSRDMGPCGPLALIAPIPVLLYAWSAERAWPVAVWSFLAGLLGRVTLIAAYLAVFPPAVLVLWAVTLPFWFAGIVLATRWLSRTAPVWVVLLSYPVLTTATEFLFATVSPHGSFGALGYALTGLTPILQVASIGGISALTFVAGFVPTAIALLIQTPAQWRCLALLAGLPCAILVSGGLMRLGEDYDGQARVALAAIDALQDDELSSEDQARRNVGTYASLARDLGRSKADVILLPEKALIQRPGWADGAAPLQAAADSTGIPVLAGWDVQRPDGSHDNVAALYAAGQAPQLYRKRRLIPGLEADFNPGRDDRVIGDLGIAICKDMDFPALIRGYGRQGVRLMLVPAWDFRSDTGLHARMALVRGVENGFSVARAAADGLLSVSDPFGREVALLPSTADHAVTLVTEVVGSPGTELEFAL